MKNILILLSAFALISSCKTKKNTTAPAQEEVTTAVSPNNTYQIESISKTDSLFASIDRGPCFGPCPVYSMKIYTSGYVVYTGQNFVKKTGTFTTKLTNEQLMEFVNVAKSLDYMTLDDSYDNPKVTDVQTVTTSIVLDKTRKRVKRRFDYPRGILNYEKLFDNLLESDQWIEVVDATKEKY